MSPEASAKKIYVSAIILGVLADTVSSTIIGGIIGTLFFGQKLDGVGFFAFSLLLGLATVVLGGFITSKRSPSSKYYNAFLMGIVSFIINAGLSFVISSPLWFIILSCILIVPSAILGAYVEMKKTGNITQ